VEIAAEINGFCRVRPKLKTGKLMEEGDMGDFLVDFAHKKLNLQCRNLKKMDFC